MPLIVKSALLEKTDDRLFLNGELFNGVVIHAEDEVVTRMVQVERGHAAGDFKSPIFEGVSLILESSHSKLSWEEWWDTLAEYEGKPLTGGIMVLNDTGICDSINRTEYGWLISNEEYWPDGRVREYSYTEDNIVRKGKFFRDGAFEETSIHYRGLVQITVSLDARRDLRTVCVTAVGAGWKEKLSSSDLEVLSEDFLGRYKAGNLLAIVGSGIDDGFLEKIQVVSLTQTTELILGNTSVTLNGFRNLRIPPNIEKIALHRNSISYDDFLSLKREYPDVAFDFRNE